MSIKVKNGGASSHTKEEKEDILFVRIIDLLFLSPVSVPVFVYT